MLVINQLKDSDSRACRLNLMALSPQASDFHASREIPVLWATT